MKSKNTPIYALTKQIGDLAASHALGAKFLNILLNRTFGHPDAPGYLGDRYRWIIPADIQNHPRYLPDMLSAAFT